MLYSEVCQDSRLKFLAINPVSIVLVVSCHVVTCAGLISDPALILVRVTPISLLSSDAAL